MGEGRRISVIHLRFFRRLEKAFDEFHHAVAVVVCRQVIDLLGRIMTARSDRSGSSSFQRDAGASVSTIKFSSFGKSIGLVRCARKPTSLLFFTSCSIP